MKKFNRLFSLVALLAVFGCLKANAQSMKIWADDIALGQGQIATVKIYAKNLPSDVKSMDLCFDLPDGVYAVSQSGDASDLTADFVYEAEDFTSAAAAGSTQTFSYVAANAGDGGYILQVYHTATIFSGDVTTEEGGLLMTFDVASNVGAVSGSLKWAKDYTYIGADMDGSAAGATDSEMTVSDKFIAPCNADGYCTICPTIGLDLSGVDAYIVTGASGESVSLKKITELAAGDAAIVKGSGNVEIPLKSGATTSESGNKLVGVQKYTDTSGKAEYFLVGAEFVKAAATSHLAAGRAYLAGLGSGAKVLNLSFDDDATAIQSVEAEQNNGVLYNLNGVRVDNAVKGVYIQNGRKVVIK